MTIEPLLTVVQTITKIPFSYERCNTSAELHSAIETYRRRPSYKIVYMALHGHDGYLSPGPDDVDLDTLATWMGDRYVDRIVHLSSCRTLNKKTAAKRFVQETGVHLLTGYTRNVDWLLSAGIDLFLLTKLAETGGHPSKSQINAVWNNSPDLFSSLGFVAFGKDGNEF